MKPYLRSLALAAALCGSVIAQELPDSVRPALKHYNLSKAKLALDGYDPVAYFPEGGGTASKGHKDLTATYRGVVYRFATAEHRSAFQANPERYEPAYGGWCAWAMADGKGDKVDVDPESFLIEEGRLLVFYDGLWGDTRKKWLKKGGQNCHPNADANWSRTTGETARRELAHHNLVNGLALGGYDPVAYFADEPTATKGQASLAYTHEGVTYNFATEANKAAFRNAPTRFEPGYGGWCAYSMSQGKKVAVDPSVFLVQDGRLILFESAAHVDAWSKAPENLARAADARWAELK